MKLFPDDLRLHVTAKAELYGSDERIYSFGFYDGYRYLKEKHFIPEFSLGDKLWTMIKNVPTEVKVTDIEIHYGTTAKGIRYTTALVNNSIHWFDGGKYNENELFTSKEELLKSL